MLKQFPKIQAVCKKPENLPHVSYVDSQLPKLTPFLESLRDGKSTIFVILSDMGRIRKIWFPDPKTTKDLIKQNPEPTSPPFVSSEVVDICHFMPDVDLPLWSFVDFAQEVCSAWKETTYSERISKKLPEEFTGLSRRGKAKLLSDFFASNSLNNEPLRYSLPSLIPNVKVSISLYMRLNLVQKRLGGDKSSDVDLVRFGVLPDSITSKGNEVNYLFRGGNVNHKDLHASLEDAAKKVSAKVLQIARGICLGFHPLLVDAINGIERVKPQPRSD